MERFSSLLASKTPFLFYTNFDASAIHLFTLDELASEDIEFSFGHEVNSGHSLRLNKSPLAFEHYAQGFEAIIDKIKSGETYLLNYTCATPVTCAHTLKEIFTKANAPFKLRVKDQFVCFSPERFIRIEDDTLFTYPMKGTIDASIEDAASKILADAKEMAEHVMVVDLLRNDLSIVGTNVRVSKFRYIDKINAGDKELLQVSSEIKADLRPNWESDFHALLLQLLPAGSISGTPKKRTLEIIHEVESYERDYFSGVFGYFDGEVLDSAVMIRFLESTNTPPNDGMYHYRYKSGGGITIESDAHAEYQEMLDKIYIP